MKADETSLWDFDGPVVDDSVVVCPECNEPSQLADWREGSSYCEDCGDHSAMVCPKCEHHVDHVWQRGAFHTYQPDTTSI